MHTVYSQWWYLSSLGEGSGLACCCIVYCQIITIPQVTRLSWCLYVALSYRNNFTRSIARQGRIPSQLSRILNILGMSKPGYCCCYVFSMCPRSCLGWHKIFSRVLPRGQPQAEWLWVAWCVGGYDLVPRTVVPSSVLEFHPCCRRLLAQM